MNNIVSLFMFSRCDYEKVKQNAWEENWKAMRLYSVVALVAFGVITLLSAVSLSIGNYKWVYLAYTFLSLLYFCISRCQLRSFLGKELVIYSFFAALLLFGIITGTVITPEELTVNYIVFMMVAPLLFTARAAVMNGLILSSMLLYIGLAFFAQHNPILSKNLVNVILYGVLSMFLTATMMRSKLQRILYHKEMEALEVGKRESQERLLNYERFLTDMVRYAASEATPDKVLNQLVEYIGQRVTADRAYIFEQNDRGTFDNTYEWCKAGVPKEKDNLQDVPYEGIIETWFAQYQESNNAIIHDIEECKKTSEAIYERLKPQGVNTLVTGPIKINGKMVGFYGVDNPPKEKLHEISNEMDMIEFMVSFMIRLRDNANALEHSALYDQLTDCKNRKALDWAYTEKLEKYFPLAVVMCDLNGLKEINDQKGHDAGDKAIVQTAQTLKSVFGKRHVYRLGGDEFIAVLPNITHPAFQKLLETAKSQLGATASLGTTISGTKDTDFESLLKAADAQMYENKKQYYISAGNDRRRHSL
ncbi:sensor domain-containing diguanylate cyclase [Collinsella sp. LCP21S3_A3]|uniref:sensor domain-containing diguanylate cyclase n=1 Tax=unclassified Collinsella TaxID=2637548 RepID=UPI003F9203B7